MLTSSEADALRNECNIYLDDQEKYGKWLHEMLENGFVDAPCQPHLQPIQRQGPSQNASCEGDTRSLVQGSDAWFKARKTKLTGSNMAVAAGLSPYATPHSYWEKLTGRLQGIEHNGDSEATLHGHMNEAMAVKAYEQIMNKSVLQTGLWCHPKVSWLGASPDGLVGDKIVLEIKCPVYKIHDKVPRHYMPQVQAEMEMTARDFCDFVSYFTGIGASGSFKRMRIFRVHKSAQYWTWLFGRLKRFWACVHMDEDPRNVSELSIHGIVPPDVRVELLHDVKL